MRPRFLADVDLNRAIAHEGRVLVTHDFATMPSHFRNFIRHNDQERWADLAFQAHTPARRTLAALFDGRYLSPIAGAVALTGLFVRWLAVGVVLQEIARP